MRIGLYPGTFDPITLGHVDIIRRACSLVDRLVIGIAINRDKAPMFDLEERVAMVEAECAPIGRACGTEIVAHPFENLLIHCAADVGASVIIRGLRAVSDFEYEFQMVGMNRAMNDDDRDGVPDGRRALPGDRLAAGQGDRAARRRRLAASCRRWWRWRWRKSSQGHGPLRVSAGRRAPRVRRAEFARRKAMAEIRDPENTLVIELKDGGQVVVEMLPDVAPRHVERIKALARAGEYDNVAFHRVIDGFMAQTGDVRERRHGGRASTCAGRAPAARRSRTCRRSSPSCRSTAACSGWRGRRTRTPATRSSSSCSTTGTS